MSQPRLGEEYLIVFRDLVLAQKFELNTPYISYNNKQYFGWGKVIGWLSEMTISYASF